MHPFFTTSTPGRPLVFAHRGGSALAPENSMAAFANALSLGADGIELDVHLSSDGRVIVNHDATIDRTTPGHGAVALMTAAALARLDVPALDDVLGQFRDARVIVELKVNSKQLAHAVVDAVKRAGALERVCAGSFGQRALNAVRGLAPAMATSAAREEVRWAVYQSWIRRAPGGAKYSGFQVPEMSGGTRVVSPRFVELAHRAGLGVQVWTVDDEDDARRLIGWGVDALITDRPDVMVRVVRGVGGSRP
ncbi:MAG TPA: glycerophosphodiester phosphodiesterase [Vicinamibacterales bacterium]|nr:glycerophosphodiester phosphodiesterase [Vicinamibacterales bacterium]